MSLIACPKVEFMDEPTTGVDPVSRRSLFKMLKSLDDSSMVLTTHRMDEAESLCDNIVIMINGRFVCYGSPGHLKEHYGQGYSIMIKHVVQDHQILLQQMPYLELESSTTSSEVDPSTGLRFNESFFKLREATKLSVIFESLWQIKSENKIHDFSVTRSSLEQVFIQFAKHQIQQPNFNQVNMV